MTKMQDRLLIYLICLFVTCSDAAAQSKVSIVRHHSLVNSESKFSDGFEQSKLACSVVCFHNKKCRIGYFHPVTKRCALYSCDTLVSNSNEDGMLLVIESRKTCPDKNWQHNGTSCYYFSTEMLSWNGSRDFCQEFGGYLAEITSSTESTFIQSEAMKHYNQTSFNGSTGWGYWVGLQKINNEWIWANSSAALTYNNWYPEEPNNGEALHDLCVHLPHHYGFKWNDFFCSRSEYFICEIGASD